MSHSSYLRNKIGSAKIIPDDDLVAGSYTSFNLVYTAGYYGVDESGGLKIVQRFASDMSTPQFDYPSADNYVSLSASNKAKLLCQFDERNNIRPWLKTLLIRLDNRSLQQGDQITVCFGDRSLGSRGIRMQSFCEDTFEMKVLVDAFGSGEFVELPSSPVLRIMPGEPVRWISILPTTIPVGVPFRFFIKAEDYWGNPSILDNSEIHLQASDTVDGLPESVRFIPGQSTMVIENLRVNKEVDLFIKVLDRDRKLIACSNAARVVSSGVDKVDGSTSKHLWHFWGDLHGQSEETVGTNSVRQYFSFGRDKAFLDVISHQGNDFQITTEFWQTLQKTCDEFYDPGRFVTFSGYEWSGNTGLGGDHNIICLRSGEMIHRSSHALVEDHSDIDLDRCNVSKLFESLKNRDIFFYAHVGGRYADLSFAADSGITPSVEIHSDHGTFEWLLRDAFSLGLRPGVVANSDDHTGRPGASYPGATHFVAFGGLTCFLSSELTRDAIFESLRQRHHYATTGERVFLDTSVKLSDGIRAIMGDIVRTKKPEMLLQIEILSQSPIERLEIFNGLQKIDTVYPYNEEDLGNRIRVYWEGAECRGRRRKSNWDGSAYMKQNHFLSFRPINFWNLEHDLIGEESQKLIWRSATAGGFSGFEIELANQSKGTIMLRSQSLDMDVPIGDIGLKDLIFEAGGLEKKVRIFRLPNRNQHLTIRCGHVVSLHKGDNPLYVKLILENGHVAWSSPIYVIK
jgi:hypothetical protein